MDHELTEELRSLEERLLDPEIRRDRHAVASLLAPEFVEFGSSGRVFTREQILELLENEQPQRIELRDFAVQTLAPKAALATWRSIRLDGSKPEASFLRSSIWVFREERWQMIFHQGTRAAED
jgi:hypothetical protein